LEAEKEIQSPQTKNTGGDSKIKKMMAEIDTEFDELDSLLRDIDTLHISSNPDTRENDEERMSNSSYEHQIKSRTKNMAPDV
jgi:hypothetical protein